MKIKHEHLRRQWWEDAEGNFLQEPDYQTNARPDQGRYFVSRIPQILTTAYVRVEDDGSTEIGQERSTWSEDLALAIAYRSNGYTLTDGILIASLACTRCLNSLAYEAGLDWGYREFGPEWQAAETECQFCIPEQASTRWPEGTLATVVGGFGALKVDQRVEIVSQGSIIDEEGNFVQNKYNVRVEPERRRATEDPGRIISDVPEEILERVDEHQNIVNGRTDDERPSPPTPREGTSEPNAAGTQE